MIPTEQQVEQRIAVLGLSAPRVTPAMIDALVESLTFDTHYIPGTTTVVATSLLPSGFTVASTKSASASPENFNLALGIEIAIRKCKDESRQKLWELEGYRLKQMLQEKSESIAAETVRSIRAQLGQPLAEADEVRAEVEGMIAAKLPADDAAAIEPHRARLRDLFNGFDDVEKVALVLAFADVVGHPVAAAA